ncbi:MAG: hypothetical protein KDA42_00570 [Planctomycetales bacterium]|nr:hypothetical protein [Planctomycetales bacterium]
MAIRSDHNLIVACHDLHAFRYFSNHSATGCEKETEIADFTFERQAVSGESGGKASTRQFGRRVD